MNEAELARNSVLVRRPALLKGVDGRAHGSPARLPLLLLLLCLCPACVVHVWVLPARLAACCHAARAQGEASGLGATHPCGSLWQRS